jgi:D-amino-acid dehydrogenase
LTGGGVIVIGGGIVGVCCALSLQRDGADVTLLDPAGPGGHASASNAGMITNFSVLPLGNSNLLRNVPRMLLDPLSPLRIRWSYAPSIAPWLVRFVLSSRPARVKELSRTLAELAARVTPAYEPLLAAAGAEDLIRRSGVLTLYRSDDRFAHGAAARDKRRGLGVDSGSWINASWRSWSPVFARSATPAGTAARSGRRTRPRWSAAWRKTSSPRVAAS